MRRPNAPPAALDRSTSTNTPTAAKSRMDSPKSQPRCPPAPRFFLLSRIGGGSSISPDKHLRGGNGGLLLSLLAAAAAFLYVSIFSRTQSDSRRFGIVIDGGSTGSRIHVFEYAVGLGGPPVLDLGVTATMRSSPGLSAFAGQPEEAGESLTELLDFGRGKVPRGLWGQTEVRLMATAGLRLLDRGVQERILNSCRKVLKSSGFLFRSDWASVITGADEGIYAWVAANYALGALGGDPQHTTGIVELGGASAQITFISNEPLPPGFSQNVRFGKAAYNLYTQSFLHLGQNVAQESLYELMNWRGLKSDPCSPRGYSGSAESSKTYAGFHNTNKGLIPDTNTSGNFSECRSAALMLLQKGKDKCMYRHCRIGSIFVPALQGMFLATENFFFTSKFFGLSSTALLSDLITAGERFCGEDWSILKRKHHTVKEEDLLHYCFSSAYIVALLHDGLGVALDDRRIVFANQIGNIPLDWALGAFIMQKMADVNTAPRSWIIGRMIIVDSPVLLFLFVIAVIAIMALTVSNWRKLQLKTLYDLEKGRYIVTHVSR